MRICQAIGSVTLSTCHRSVRGATWRIALPLSQDSLRGEVAENDEPIVVYDELGPGNGSLIAVSDGAEAAAPFYPDQKPVDAYCAALLDTITLEHAPSERRDLR